MNRWATGLLIGAGVGVVGSLLVILLRGGKTQRFLGDRLHQLREAVPEPEQVQQFAQQVAGRVSQAAGDAKDTAQQTMKKVMQATNGAVDKVKQLTPVGS